MIMRKTNGTTSTAILLGLVPVFCICAIAFVGLYQALKGVTWLIQNSTPQ
jgi:hypothetical protein